MKYLDLTLWLNENTQVFPGEENAIITEDKHIEENNYNTHKITIPTHIGTHIDFPYHMIKNGKRSDSFDINNFVGKGFYLDINNINYEGLEKGDIVFLSTHQDKKDLFKDNKTISENIIDEMVSKKIKVLCIDIPTPDDYPYSLHKKLLGNNILIVENVIDVDLLKNKNFKCILSPLKLSNVDGAPCRVTIELNEEDN